MQYNIILILCCLVFVVHSTRIEHTDYLCIGTGTAISVTCGKIAEAKPYLNVLMVEEGLNVKDANNPEVVRNADLYLDATADTQLERNYMSQPIPGLNGKSLVLPRFNGTGGCSQHNGELFRPMYPLSINKLNLSGWKYSDLLPHIVATRNRIEARLSPQQPNSVQLQTIAGLQSVSNYPVVPDNLLYNATQLGIQRTLHHFREINSTYWRRRTSYDAYVEESSSYNRNLHVRSQTRGVRLIRIGDIVIGAEVQDTKTSELYYILVTREVLLGGGFADTPRILFESGVGNITDMNAQGVKVNMFGITTGNLINRPEVGRNWHDHWAFITIHRPAEGVYVEGAGGIFRSAISVVAALNDTEPDVAFDLTQVNQAWHEYFGWPKKAFYNVMYTLKPFGPGVLKFNLTQRAPIFDTKLYEKPEELQHMIAMFKEGRKLMSGLTHLYPEELSPGPSVQTDEQIISFLMNWTAYGSHGVGTCRMGTDANAVVDLSLRVRGLQRVRIVDVSVWPTTPGAGTNPLALAIGSKAADIILAGN